MSTVPTGSTGRAPAALVAVGDELLAGAHPDLNSPEVARHLADLGLTVEEIREGVAEIHHEAATVHAAAKPMAEAQRL